MSSCDCGVKYVIVHADKTVLKIRGLKVKGLDAQALEQTLSNCLQSAVRVIGVTGSSIDMDVYGMEEQSILKDEAGIIRAISLTEGITASEVTQIACAKKSISVNFDEIPKRLAGCAAERWRNVGE